MARRHPGETSSPPPAAAPRPPERRPEDGAPAASLPVWFDPSSPPLHDDLDARVVLFPDDAAWRETLHPGLEMRLLERFAGDEPRMSAQLRLASGIDSVALGAGTGQELLVQRGEVEAGDSAWPSGLYARLPGGGTERFDALTLEGGTDGAGSSALLYVAAGHIADADTEQRRIDTSEGERWLPGPVTGTEVMPLHGHDSANVMLIRWLGAVAFQPRLDPLGEEVLVLEGCLHDATGDYPAGSWIRNPVPAWQSWSGDPGTVVYYKSGHFATSTNEGVPPGPTAA